MKYFSTECPLIIGVTGHRDLLTEDFNIINIKLDEIFNDFEQKFNGMAVVAFSPLAEGADCLFAKKAIARGYKLFVPLPMPISEYEKDFISENYKKEFHELLGKAEKVFEIPIPCEFELMHDLSIQSNKELRYALLGKFMVSHCEILVSLNDDMKQIVLGGTSYVTDLMIEGKSSIDNPDKWIAPEYGLVYHLVTPRRKTEGRTIGNQFAWSIIPSWAVLDGTVEEKVKRIITGIKIIHEHLKNYSRSCIINKYVSDNNCTLVSDNSIYTKFSPWLKTISEFFDLADSASSFMQKKTSRYFYSIFTFGILAAVFSGIYSDVKIPCDIELLKENSPYMLLLFIIFMIVSLGIWIICKRKDYQNKHQDLRAVTEALRVQFYWGIAGINESVADHYLEEKRSVLDWIRVAIRYSCLDAMPDSKITETNNFKNNISYDKIVEIIRSNWIFDQKEYFTKNALRMSRQMAIHEKTAKILFGLGIVIAFLQFIFQIYCYNYNQNYNQFFSSAMIFMSSILPVIAGLIKYRIDKLGWNEIAQHYKDISERFRRADYCLEKISEAQIDSEAKRKDVMLLIHNLGVAALLENSEWLFLRRLKNIDLPG